MSLLFDRLLFEKWKPLRKTRINPKLWEMQIKAIGPYLHRAQVFQCGNVADYMYSSGQTIDSFGCLPSLRPPFPETWAEWPAPNSYKETGLSHFGCLICADGLDLWKKLAFNDDPQTHLNGADGQVVVAILFMRYNGEIYGPLTVFPLAVDSHGDAKDPPFGKIQYTVVGCEDEDFMDEDRLFFREFIQVLYIPFMMMSFLNCRNVSVRESKPDDKLSRATMKRRGYPLSTFKTLQIEPMKSVLRAEGSCEASGLKKALHICRGHFSTYTDKGLFGKYKGTFWIPNHVRGSRENGVVVKDYAVKM